MVDGAEPVSDLIAEGGDGTGVGGVGAHRVGEWGREEMAQDLKHEHERLSRSIEQLQAAHAMLGSIIHAGGRA
ncbi:hypothetical protein [Streptomyces niveus]|uniref:hypothetical protein n=1 Tax=Streptomyces niveus TaxID=193462 RepID=UPI0036E19109